MILEGVSGHAFKGLEDLESICTEAQGKASRPHPIYHSIGRAIERAHGFAPTLDVIVQQQPIAAFVWGSIRFILQVSDTPIREVKLIIPCSIGLITIWCPGSGLCNEDNGRH